MVKAKKSVLFALVMALTIVMCFSLAACNNDGKGPGTTPEYTIKFMVKENGTGEWKDYSQPVKAIDGKVTLPQDPSIEGFSFRGWFTDDTCETPFDENNVTSSMTVYAHMSDKVLTVKVNKGDVVDTKVDQTVANLTTLENEYKNDANQKHLTFDGWYTNESCTTRFNGESGTTEVFGRYMALVNFIDGYSNIEYNQLIIPGEKMAPIDESKVKMSYMDSIYGYSVVDENGKPIEKDSNGASKLFDINQNIDVNTTLNILWAGKGINYVKANESLVAIQLDSKELTGVKALRIPEYAQLNGQGDFLPVETVALADALTFTSPDIETIIFAEGIKTISGVHSACEMMEQAFQVETQLSTIILPDSLKIIDTAFWNLRKVKEINIPYGVEVIIDSFWNGQAAQGGFIDEIPFGNTTLDIDINIPESVKDISLVPGNLKFPENSPYFYEGNMLYKKGVDNNYETLICMTSQTADETVINIKEGVKYIKAGALYKSYSKGTPVTINLPKSFENVVYNEDASKYPYYVGGVTDTGMSSGDKNVYVRLKSDTNTTAKGKSICANVELLNKLVFNSPVKPAGLDNNAFMTCTGYKQYADFIPNAKLEQNDKVLFLGLIEDGQPVNVVIRTYYDSKVDGTYTLQDVNSNSTLITQNMIANCMKLNERQEIISVKQFGEDYFVNSEAVEGKKVNVNQYINVVYSDKPAGAIVEDIDGVMTVTGFDQSTAIFNADTGFYSVIIPNVYKNKKVTKIADNAFKNQTNIEKVVIASNISEIGDNAFQGASQLSNVLFNEGSSLNSIGASAFEDTILTTIELPLLSLTNVGPYAFRIKTLQEFLPASGSESRVFDIGKLKNLQKRGPLKNKIIIYKGVDNKGMALYKIKDFKRQEDVDRTGQNITSTYRNVFDVELVATAAAVDSYNFIIGIDSADLVVFNTTVKTGSVYYLDNVMNYAAIKADDAGVIFTKNIVAVEENAFTRMNEKFLTKEGAIKIAVNNISVPSDQLVDKVLTIDEIKAFFNDPKFSDKWLDGGKLSDAQIEKFNVNVVTSNWHSASYY